MQMIADFNMFGQKLERKGKVYNVIMQLPGPFILCVEDGADTPAQTYVLSLAEEDAIIQPGGNNGRF